jgi:formamidopyrimidine-DNA glycosylase
MYLLPAKSRLPKHAAIVFELGDHSFVFEDTRYFGRITLDTCAIEKLGPEPLDREFTTEKFGEALKRSKQPIKVKLLDQSLVAGIGNIYASEALFLARISPRSASRDLNQGQVACLWKAIRQVLREAIRGGSTVPLDHAGTGSRDGLFYFGLREGQPNSYEERLRVYNRAGQSCVRCSGKIERFVQAARSTFYCTRCQRKTKTN